MSTWLSSTATALTLMVALPAIAANGPMRWLDNHPQKAAALAVPIVTASVWDARSRLERQTDTFGHDTTMSYDTPTNAVLTEVCRAMGYRQALKPG